MSENKTREECIRFIEELRANNEISIERTSEVNQSKILYHRRSGCDRNLSFLRVLSNGETNCLVLNGEQIDKLTDFLMECGEIDCTCYMNTAEPLTLTKDI